MGSQLGPCWLVGWDGSSFILHVHVTTVAMATVFSPLFQELSEGLWNKDFRRGLESAVDDVTLGAISLFILFVTWASMLLLLWHFPHK